MGFDATPQYIITSVYQYIITSIHEKIKGAAYAAPFIILQTKPTKIFDYLTLNLLYHLGG